MTTTLTNGNIRVLINRTLLADGYNYYLSLFIKGYDNFFYINDNYQQKESILSEKAARIEANRLLFETTK